MSPGFVRRGTKLDLEEAPWASGDSSGVLFMLEGALPELKLLCDRLLNGPGKLDYRPSDAWVLLTVQTITGFAPKAGAPAYTYNEAALWVAVENSAGEAGFVLPYVFHERTVPTAVGRELWGFAKESADVTWSADLVNGFRSAVQALTWRGGVTTPTFGPLMAVAPTATWAAPFQQQLKLALDANGQKSLDLFEAVQLGIIEGLLGIRSKGLRMLMSQRFDFLHLKQSLAAAGHGCDLQQVVRMPATMRRRGPAIPTLWSHELRLEDVVSHPITGDLGFPGLVVGSPLAFNAPFTFTLEAASKTFP